MKFAVFISGQGTNLQAILNAIKRGEIKAECALVFSNKRKAYGLKRAQDAGIKTLCLEPRKYATPQSFERDLVIHLKEAKIDFVVLAGYMKILSNFFVKEYKNRILNIHPALLPAFKGGNGIKDAWTYGAKVVGATVHFVDEKIDHGPIIMQESIKVQDRDTLETITEKIHKLEYKIFPKAISLFAEGRLKIKGRKVDIIEKRRK